MPALSPTEGVPEGSQEGGVNGVSVVHVEVVPAAFGGKVVEPQSQDCVRPGRHTQRENLNQQVGPNQQDGGAAAHHRTGRSDISRRVGATRTREALQNPIGCRPPPPPMVQPNPEPRLPD